MVATVRNVVESGRHRGNPADPIRATPGLSGQGTVLEAMLNEALATELVCALRYRRHSTVTRRSLADLAKRKFLRYAQVQQEQADRIAERIVQVGGAPHVDTGELAARSQQRLDAGTPLQDLLGEDLQFERMTIENYDGMVQYFETRDQATAQLLASILTIHEEQAEELAELLIGPSLPPQG